MFDVLQKRYGKVMQVERGKAIYGIPSLDNYFFDFDDSDSKNEIPY